MIPFLNNKVLLRNTQVPVRIIENTGLPQISKSGFKIDYSKTILNSEFENQIYFNALNYMFSLNAYKQTQVYLKETLSLINANIKE